MNPFLQEHMKEPLVLTQSAFSSHVFATRHSSTSDEKQKRSFNLSVLFLFQVRQKCETREALSSKFLPFHFTLLATTFNWWTWYVITHKDFQWKVAKGKIKNAEAEVVCIVLASLQSPLPFVVYLHKAYKKNSQEAYYLCMILHLLQIHDDRNTRMNRLYLNMLL